MPREHPAAHIRCENIVKSICSDLLILGERDAVSTLLEVQLELLGSREEAGGKWNGPASGRVSHFNLTSASPTNTIILNLLKNYSVTLEVRNHDRSMVKQGVLQNGLNFERSGKVQAMTLLPFTRNCQLGLVSSYPTRCLPKAHPVLCGHHSSCIQMHDTKDQSQA